MRIKSLECPKIIKHYEKKILGMSDAWSTIRLSHRLREQAYYIVDCRILRFGKEIRNSLDFILDMLKNFSIQMIHSMQIKSILFFSILEIA